jgi:hypothetical protein
MRDPLLALERMAGVTKELLVIETVVDMPFVHSPAPAFYPWELRGGETSWSGPKPTTVLGMLRTVGFTLLVSYPTRRLSAAVLFGPPTSARTPASFSSTPRRPRKRLVRDFVKSALTQRHLVTHGSW